MNKKLVPWIASGCLAVVLLVGGTWYFKVKSASAAPANYITATVKTGNIKKTVNATGTIQAPTQDNLSFSGSGKVTEIDVKVGDQVKAGQVLAKQDQTDAQNQVIQAQNTLTQAQLKLSELKAPPSQVSVLQGQDSLAKAQVNAASAQSALQTLQSYKNADILQAAIDKATGQEQATLQEYKDNPADLDAAISQAANNYTGAQDDLNLAKAQLAQTTAGPSSADLQLAQSQVSQAQASLAAAQSGLSSTTISAPVDGTIAAVNGQVGQSPSSGGSSGGNGSGSSGSNSSSGFITLIGNSSTMQVVVPVDEADIDSVQANQSVDMTLDAYPDKHFTGSVTQVSPTGNTQSGVTTFDVTVSVPNDSSMKPGMSANISIIVAQKQNVLTVPSMAVNDTGSAQTVSLVPADGSSRPERRQVQIGIDDGNNAEVLSGLQAGDQVVIGVRSQTSSGSQSGSRSGLGGFGGGFGGGFSGGGSGGNRGRSQQGN